MDDRLESESQIASTTGATKAAASESDSRGASGAPAQAPGLRDELDEIAGDSYRDNPETRALIQRCLDGTEPLGRDLRDWEPEKLSPRMLQAVLLRAAGFKGIEVATALDLTSHNVSVALHHPYGRKILHALMGEQSGRILDIRSKLEEYSADLLDKLYGQAMLAQDVDQVTRVTFGLLDRAGYATKTKVEIDHRASRATADNDVLRRLADALSESESVDSRVMTSFVSKPPPDDGRALMVGSVQSSERSDTDATRSEAGHSGGIRKVG